MEQASNVFNKGLQMDTHPMVQGNDTLTDALNGTFITMNGNEVILQNDMGNAKIDNAYLPSGFEPVGIKEYGGVIYVASYNPLTNKSQIGSFPSPERRIGNENTDLGGNLTLSVNNEDFKYTEENGINFLQNDSVLIPLTSDTSLHAGDKFTVYSSMIWDNKDIISNFENTVIETKRNEISIQIEEIKTNNPKYEKETPEAWEERLNQIEGYKELNEEYTELEDIPNKIYSPKNKLYTLQLGVLNSQNEFVDVTESLKRWDGKGIVKSTSDSIINTDKMSDLLAFNTGYFIAKNFISPTGGTSDDKELILERQKIAANTYSYKLVGPLYLKATINHITSFNYAIQGKKTGDKSADIEVIANITYNCPDGGTFTETADSDIYSTYELLDTETAQSQQWFDLFKRGNEGWAPEEIRENTQTSVSNINYNELTNTYSITVIKKYSITGTNNIYDYYICPTLPNSSFPEDSSDSNINIPIYIKELSVEGSLDINRLGTGELSVSSWRFINNYDENSGLITYGFNAYPEYGHEFRNLTFWFRDIVEDYPPNESNTQNEASYAHGIDLGDLGGTWDGEETNGGTQDGEDTNQGTQDEEETNQGTQGAEDTNGEAQDEKEDLGSGDIKDETYSGDDARDITTQGGEYAIDEDGAIEIDITGWEKEDKDGTGEVIATHDIYYETESTEEGGTVERLVVNSQGDDGNQYQYFINVTVEKDKVSQVTTTTLNTLTNSKDNSTYYLSFDSDSENIYNLVDILGNTVGRFQLIQDGNILTAQVSYNTITVPKVEKTPTPQKEPSIKEITKGKKPKDKTWPKYIEYIKEGESEWIKIPVESNIVPVNGNKELNWENYKLNPNTLYRVLITYDDVDINNGTSVSAFIKDLSSDNPYWELYLTTDLLNDYADPLNAEFERDFKYIQTVEATPIIEHSITLKENTPRQETVVTENNKYYDIIPANSSEGTLPTKYEICRTVDGKVEYEISFESSFNKELYPEWFIPKANSASSTTSFKLGSISQGYTGKFYEGGKEIIYNINPVLNNSTEDFITSELQGEIPFTYEEWAGGKRVERTVNLTHELVSLADFIRDTNNIYLTKKWIDFDSYTASGVAEPRAYRAEWYTNDKYPIESSNNYQAGAAFTGTENNIYGEPFSEETRTMWSYAFEALGGAYYSASGSTGSHLIAMGTPNDNFSYKHAHFGSKITMIWIDSNYFSGSETKSFVLLTTAPYHKNQNNLDVLKTHIKNVVEENYKYFVNKQTDRPVNLWYISNQKNEYTYLDSFTFNIIGNNVISQEYSIVGTYNNDLLNFTLPIGVQNYTLESNPYKIEQPEEFSFKDDMINIIKSTDSIRTLYLGKDSTLDVSAVDTSNTDYIYEGKTTVNILKTGNERTIESKSTKLEKLDDTILPTVSKFQVPRKNETDIEPEYDYIMQITQDKEWLGRSPVLSYKYVPSLRKSGFDYKVKKRKNGILE